VNWSRPTDSGSTENARVENRKLFNILFKFCTYVFHRCRFVLAFSVLAFSTLAYSYLRFPYLHIPSPGTFVFRTCVFSRPVKRPILHQHTKFAKDRSNRCGDIAIFVIFKLAAAAVLDFQKFEILTAIPLWGQCGSTCQISSNSVRATKSYA